MRSDDFKSVAVAETPIRYAFYAHDRDDDGTCYIVRQHFQTRMVVMDSYGHVFPVGDDGVPLDDHVLFTDSPCDSEGACESHSVPCWEHKPKAAQ